MTVTDLSTMIALTETTLAQTSAIREQLEQYNGPYEYSSQRWAAVEGIRASQGNLVWVISELRQLEAK